MMAMMTMMMLDNDDDGLLPRKIYPSEDPKVAPDSLAQPSACGGVAVRCGPRACPTVASHTDTKRANAAEHATPTPPLFAF